MFQKFKHVLNLRIYEARQAGHGGSFMETGQEFFEGDWIVKNDRGKSRVFTDEQFKKEFIALEEAVKPALGISLKDAWKDPDTFYAELAKERETGRKSLRRKKS